MPDRAAIVAKLTELVKAEVDVSADTLAEDMAIREGLGLDSVDLMSVVTRVEEAYRVRFTHPELEGIVTVGNLIDLVVAKSAS